MSRCVPATETLVTLFAMMLADIQGVVAVRSRHNQVQVAITLATLALLPAELLFISQHYDAYTLVMRTDLSGWRSAFAYLGQLAKLVTLGACLLILLLKNTLRQAWAVLLQGASRRASWWFRAAHLISFVCFLVLTEGIFADPHKAAGLPAMYYGLWLGAAGLLLGFWLLALAPCRLWGVFFRGHRTDLGLVLGLLALFWPLSRYANRLWGPMSELTFIVSAILLALINEPPVYADFDSKTLGLGNFAVNVAPACSGYEGIALVLSFTAVYLYLYKREFRFPQACLLFPIGALCIWLLNALRIALLVTLGEHWSPEIAVGGFHSQAGWLSFILTSLGLLYLSRQLRFFVHARPTSIPRANDPLVLPSLAPLVALLAAILLTSAFSADFDWLYPLRVLAVVAVLALCWKPLALWPLRCRTEPLIAGFAVALLWIALVPRDDDTASHFTAQLGDASPALAALWLALRIVGACITVPIAEELGFRGYLLSVLSGIPVRLVGRIPLSVLAVVGSSLAFGFLHGAWLAGSLAGLVYAIVRLRSDSIVDPIVAHALTNALIFFYAAYSGDWYLI